MPDIHKGVEVREFKTKQQWFDWLERNHNKADALWVKIAKKNTGVTTITYEEAREGALMYGWIDGLVNSLDATYYLQRMTPRRPKGVWSKINRDIALQLIADGAMKPSGLAQVEAAQHDGRWERAYDGPANMQVPADFAAALAKNPKAQTAFNSLDKTNRFAFLFRIQTATPAARPQRIERLVAMLQAGEVFHS